MVEDGIFAVGRKVERVRLSRREVRGEVEVQKKVESAGRFFLVVRLALLMRSHAEAAGRMGVENGCHPTFPD